MSTYKGPMEEFHNKQGETSHKMLENADPKYTDGMDNGAKLEKSNNALASYVKKNRMKY